MNDEAAGMIRKILAKMPSGSTAAALAINLG